LLGIILPATGQDQPLLALVGIGLFVGFLGGMFGVGGGFLMTPLLNVVLSIPMPVAIGTSLAQMTGLATSASVTHRKHGHINFKMALLLITGSQFGVKLGSSIIAVLKDASTVTIFGKCIQATEFYVPIAYIVMLLVVGINMFIESINSLKHKAGHHEVETSIAKKVRSLRVGPFINVSNDGEHRISIWIVLVLGFFIGTLSGAMGVGGGFLLTPALIYIIGVPTFVAIGTDLFVIIFVSLGGTYFHAPQGNVDIVLMLLLLVGCVVGAQIGAFVSKKVAVGRIRYLFSLIVLAAAVMVVWKLVAQFV
jgi:uncharacterized protein